MRITLKSSILAGLCALCVVGKSSSLKDISKPYLGEYECKQATYGEKDYLEDFTYIRMELKSGDRFVLSYCDKLTKKKNQVEGEFTYDEQTSTVTLQLEGDACIKRQFPLKDGVLLVVTTLGNKILQLRFEQK